VVGLAREIVKESSREGVVFQIPLKPKGWVKALWQAPNVESAWSVLRSIASSQIYVFLLVCVGLLALSLPQTTLQMLAGRCETPCPVPVPVPVPVPEAASVPDCG